MPGKYKNPPFVRAVCEFRFLPSSDQEWDATSTGLIYTELQNDYPLKRSALRSAEIAPGFTVATGQDGVLFTQNTETSIVQLAPNIISLIQNNPYPGWEAYAPAIRKVLDAYRQVVSPHSIQRIGLRYTNHIDFPELRVKLEDWLTYFPNTPNNVLGDDVFIAAFGVLTQYLHADGRDILTLQLGHGGVNEVGGARLVLDLDYGLLQPNAISFDGIDQWLDNAHTVIEGYFEASILPNLRERFGPIE